MNESDFPLGDHRDLSVSTWVRFLSGRQTEMQRNSERREASEFYVGPLYNDLIGGGRPGKRSSLSISCIVWERRKGSKTN